MGIRYERILDVAKFLLKAGATVCYASPKAVVSYLDSLVIVGVPSEEGFMVASPAELLPSAPRERPLIPKLELLQKPVKFCGVREVYLLKGSFELPHPSGEWVSFGTSFCFVRMNAFRSVGDFVEFLGCAKEALTAE